MWLYKCIGQGLKTEISYFLLSICYLIRSGWANQATNKQKKMWYILPSAIHQHSQVMRVVIYKPMQHIYGLLISYIAFNIVMYNLSVPDAILFNSYDPVNG